MPVSILKKSPFSEKCRESYDLKVLWTGSHYQIVDDIGSTDQIELKVKQKPTNKSETFIIDEKGVTHSKK